MEFYIFKGGYTAEQRNYRKDSTFPNLYLADIVSLEIGVLNDAGNLVSSSVDDVFAVGVGGGNDLLAYTALTASVSGEYVGSLNLSTQELKDYIGSGAYRDAFFQCKLNDTTILNKGFRVYNSVIDEDSFIPEPIDILGTAAFKNIGLSAGDVVAVGEDGKIDSSLFPELTASAVVSFEDIEDKPTLVSGSSQITFSGLSGVPSGLVSSSYVLPANVISSSAQVDYNGIQNKPEISATASYVEYANVANKPTLVSGSSQINYSGLSGIPSGIVSSSYVLPSGVVSGSGQISFSGISGVPSGLVSQSYVLPSGVVSSSAQVSFGSISGKPTLVSSSAQIAFSGITGKPTLVSGSGQIAYSGITGKPTGLISSSVQVSFTGITDKPTTLSGYGITDAALQSDLISLSSSLKSKINAKVDSSSFNSFTGSINSKITNLEIKSASFTSDSASFNTRINLKANDSEVVKTWTDLSGAEANDYGDNPNLYLTKLRFNTFEDHSPIVQEGAFQVNLLSSPTQGLMRMNGGSIYNYYYNGAIESETEIFRDGIYYSEYSGAKPNYSLYLGDWANGSFLLNGSGAYKTIKATGSANVDLRLAGSGTGSVVVRTSNGDNGYVVSTEVKATTGDYGTGNFEGRRVKNTTDSNIKEYWDGAWRTIASW